MEKRGKTPTLKTLWNMEHLPVNASVADDY